MRWRHCDYTKWRHQVTLYVIIRQRRDVINRVKWLQNLQMRSHSVSPLPQYIEVVPLVRVCRWRSGWWGILSHHYAPNWQEPASVDAQTSTRIETLKYLVQDTADIQRICENRKRTYFNNYKNLNLKWINSKLFFPGGARSKYTSITVIEILTTATLSPH